MSQLDQLKLLFPLKGDVYTQAQINTLIAGVTTAAKGIATTATNPGTINNGDIWLATPGAGPYVNFGNQSVPVKVGSQYVSQPFFIYSGGTWNLQYILVDAPVMTDYIPKLSFAQVATPVTSATPVDVTSPLQQGFLLNTGVISATAAWSTSFKRVCAPGDIINYSGVRPTVGSGTPAATIIGYDVNGANPQVLLTYAATGGVAYTGNITIPAGVNYYSACGRASTGDVFIITQNGSALTQLVVYARNVNGLTALQQQANANTSGLAGLLSGIAAQSDYAQSIPAANYGYLTGAGVFTASANFRAVLMQKVNPGDTYRYNGVRPFSSSSSFAAVVGFDINGLNPTIIVDKNTAAFAQYDTGNQAVPAGVYYISACSRLTAGDVFNFYLNAQKVNPVYLPASLTAAAQMSSIVSTFGVWNAIGDSITNYDQKVGVNPAGTPTIGYQSNIRARITFSGYNNLGLSGYALSAKNPDDGKCIVNQKATWPVADLFTLLAGTNDFRLDRPVGTNADYTGNTGNLTYYGALRIAIDQFYTLNANCRIILMTPLQRSNSGYDTTTTNAAGFKLVDFVNAVLWVAAYEALPVVDLYNKSGISLRNAVSTYTFDGLHPNNAGYVLVSKLLLWKMFEVL